MYDWQFHAHNCLNCLEVSGQHIIMVCAHIVLRYLHRCVQAAHTLERTHMAKIDEVVNSAACGVLCSSLEVS